MFRHSPDTHAHDMINHKCHMKRKTNVKTVTMTKKYCNQSCLTLFLLMHWC